MNERIKQIADECGLYIAYDNKKVTDKEIEFFAESIVRECVEVAAKDWHTPDGWGYTFGQKKAIEFIKEHFGVE
jgi:hypothetical protein